MPNEAQCGQRKCACDVDEIGNRHVFIGFVSEADIAGSIHDGWDARLVDEEAHVCAIRHALEGWCGCKRLVAVCEQRDDGVIGRAFGGLKRTSPPSYLRWVVTEPRVLGGSPSNGVFELTTSCL